MALWVVILVMILLLVTMLRQTETEPPQLAYSDFLAKIESESIESVEIEEGNITGRLTDGASFRTFAPVVSDELVSRLHDKNVEIVARPKPEGSFWRQALVMWFPLLLIIGLWIFFIRQMQSGGGNAHHRAVDLLHPPDAVGRRQGDELRQVARAPAHREPAAGHLR
jgi:cell division protease FtsH